MSTSSPDEIEIQKHPEYVEIRHRGVYELARYLSLMERSVQACKEQQRTRLLVDLRELSNFQPSVADRYEMGKLGARLGAGVLKVAVLGPPEQIERKFSSLVARNLGLNIEAFTDRDRAIEWLLGSKK